MKKAKEGIKTIRAYDKYGVRKYHFTRGEKMALDVLNTRFICRQLMQIKEQGRKENELMFMIQETVGTIVFSLMLIVIVIAVGLL